LRGTLRDHMDAKEYIKFISRFMEPGYNAQSDWRNCMTM